MTIEQFNAKLLAEHYGAAVVTSHYLKIALLCVSAVTLGLLVVTWRTAATQELAEPEEARASPMATKQDRRRIKELERELRRKDRALAETAALLVLSKKSRRSSAGARTNDRGDRKNKRGSLA